VTTTSWSVGLSWSNAFSPGNAILLAVGAPAHVRQLGGLAGGTPDDSGLAIELATLLRLSDTFSLTPALFWLSRPRGAMGTTTTLAEVLPAGGPEGAGGLSVWGGLVRATLRF
jgi:hypothetical protein